jgi:outer membrane protein assembly factor BamB
MASSANLRPLFAALMTAVVGLAVVGLPYLLQSKTPSAAPTAVAAEPGKSATTSAQPHAWTMFGGDATRNMVNLVEKNPPTDWSVKKGKEKNLKWVARLGSRAYGGPIVADGKVFVGTNNDAPRNPEIVGDKGNLMCFDQATGKFLWQAVHDKLEAGRVNDWPKEGICSTPTVEGKLLYYVSNRGEVVCARTDGLTDGKNEGETTEKYKGPTSADFIWRYDMINTLNVNPHNMSSCCPLIIGDLMYLTTSNGVDAGHLKLPSPEAPSFICLNKKTGKLIWRSNAPGKNIMHGQWSNPCYIESKERAQVIFPGGDGWIRSFEPRSGEELWRFDCNPKDSKYDLGGKGTRSDFIGTPVYADGKIYIGTGQDPEHNEGVGHFWCIDPNGKGDVSPDVVTSAPGVFPPKTKPNPNSKAVWHYGGDAPKADADDLGRDYLIGRTMSTAAIKDGIVYIADLGGYLFALDAKTGKRLWWHDLEGQVWGSPLWVDGKVFIGNDAGVVHIFEAGREKKEPKKIVVGGGAIRSNMTVVDGVLYLMSSQYLYAIETGAKGTIGKE